MIQITAGSGQTAGLKWPLLLSRAGSLMLTEVDVGVSGSQDGRGQTQTSLGFTSVNSIVNNVSKTLV